MTTDTLRQITGVLRTPEGTAFVNQTLTWFRERRQVQAQGSSVVLDEPFFITTDAAGAIDHAVMAGNYLVMARLKDADRYFRVSVPDQAGPFNIADLVDAPPVTQEIISQMQALVIKARAWAENPEDVEVDAGEFSAFHYSQKAAASAAQAALYEGIWVQNLNALLADIALTYSAGQPGTVVVGQIVQTRAEGFSYQVVAASATVFDLVTAGGVKLRHPLGPYVILISGQSNAAGAYPSGFDEGPNPASPLVRTWDNVAESFGSSNWTKLPWTRSNPDGNLGRNNYALARAHRIADETGRPVVVVFYATGGRNIESWIDPLSSTDMWTGMKAATESALAACGRTEIDELIWAQGEANFEDTADVFLNKLTMLFNRFRLETWFNDQTPSYFMEPTQLHERYTWLSAARVYCSRVDSRVIFVPTRYPNATEYQVNGTGDFSHNLGWALWQSGYFGISQAARVQNQDVLFYGRGVGSWRIGNSMAMMAAKSLTNFGCWEAGAEFNPNTDFNAANSIAWGVNSKTFGSTSFAFGSDCETAAGANFAFVAGDNVKALASAGRSFAAGRDINLAALYTFASGRGHILSDAYGAAVGSYSRYTAAESDPVRFQAGVGTSATNRRNGLTVRQSGTVEIYAPSTAADPTQKEEITFRRINNTTLQISMRGADGVVRSTTLTLA